MAFSGCRSGRYRRVPGKRWGKQRASVLPDRLPDSGRARGQSNRCPEERPRTDNRRPWSENVLRIYDQCEGA